MATEPVALTSAAKFFPTTDGRPVHINTLRRWVARGVVIEGRAVRLKAHRIGGRTYTTEQAISQFIEDCSSRRTEPLVETRADEQSIVRRLTAKGVFGAKAKREMLGLSKRVENSRVVPGVLSGGPVRKANWPDNGRGIDCGETAAAEVYDTTERLPVSVGAAARAED